jgi:capsular exopolysaccharide synthesis family protein
MKKTKIDRSIDTEALGFQVRESYKTARTNIAYSIFKKGCKKVAFTSSTKCEGKTVTSINVASALAQQVGTKVIVVECDLRRPRVNTALKITPTPGLTNYLNEECSLEDIVKDTKIENLKAITYGAIPPNPSELLASESMFDLIKTLEKNYDYIIFDTPPIGVVIDALPIMKASDGVVIVARNNSTTYPELSRTVEVIKRTNAKILGVILNRVKPHETRKGKSYYSRYGGYYKTSTND